MLKASELRVGNWVNVPHGNVKIAHFYKDGAHFTDGCGGNFTSLDPIPLTPEILEQAGFVESAGTSKELVIAEGYTLNSFHSGRNGVGLYDANGCFSGFTFDYVHELQNVFFCFTGEELKIELNASVEA